MVMKLASQREVSPVPVGATQALHQLYSFLLVHGTEGWKDIENFSEGETEKS